MDQLTISEVARQVGLRPSAIRYYERLGLLFPAERKGGQRRYDNTTVYRLAVIQRARQTGFTLDEIKELFFGFAKGTPPGERWQQMSTRKLVELEQLSDQIETMKGLLRGIQNCRCDALNECGEKLLRRGPVGAAVKRLPLGRG